jgi:hypothetical protein
MRVLFFCFIVLLSLSCAHNKDARARRSSLDIYDSLRSFTGDTLTFKFTKDEVERVNFWKVDSLFYYTYLSKDSIHFKGFSVSDSRFGVPTCAQYYYGTTGHRIPGYRQMLIFQAYVFNDHVNDLYLLTFDEKDSLLSTLHVASWIWQADIEPFFSSVMYPDNRIEKSEVTFISAPDSIKSIPGDSEIGSEEQSNQLWYTCRDSIGKEFRFEKGKFFLTKKDSVRKCFWREP